MSERAEFCQYPGDTEGCIQSLIQASDDDAIDEHCILEGLRANWQQCRQVFLKGLYEKASPINVPAHKKQEFEEACKGVFLFGYPLGIKAIPELFYEAYYRRVRCITRRRGIKDRGQPSTDDILQQVFMDLHRHFRKGAKVSESLAAYVSRTTTHECFRELKKAARYQSGPGEKVQIKASLSTTLLPPSVVELWEDLDQTLVRSEQGNLINRTILAQRCLEACTTGQKISARQLRADWQHLSEISEGILTDLHARVTREIKHPRGAGLVRIAANLMNEGLVVPYQMAVVFAAGAGMDFDQTANLLTQMRDLSSNAVHARICRIHTALSPLKKEEQP